MSIYNNSNQDQQPSTATRNVVQEGNIIKQAIVNAHRDDYAFKFTSLAETLIPGLAPRKLRPAERINYIPDFYHVSDLLHKMYSYLKNDRKMKGISDYDEYGFILYCQYAIFYHVLRVHNNCRNSSENSRSCQTFLENCGIDQVRLPMILNRYLSAIGKFVHPTIKREFEVRLPTPASEGVVYNNYFVSQATAHLLPNFRLIMVKAMFLAQSSPNSVVAASRTVKNFRDANFANFPNYGGNMRIARPYESRVPGLSKLKSKIVSDVLLEYILETLNFDNWISPWHRYMQLNERLITHLFETYKSVVYQMDSFSVFNFSLAGNDLLLAILRESDNQDVVHQDVYRDEGEQNQAPQHRVVEEFSHKFRILTKASVVDGNAIIATITPVVRLASTHNTLPIPDVDFVEPNDVWFQSGYEFEVSEMTINEATSAFRKL